MIYLVSEVPIHRQHLLVTNYYFYFLKGPFTSIVPDPYIKSTSDNSNNSYH